MKIMHPRVALECTLNIFRFSSSEVWQCLIQTSLEWSESLGISGSRIFEILDTQTDTHRENFLMYIDSLELIMGFCSCFKIRLLITIGNCCLRYSFNLGLYHFTIYHLGALLPKKFGDHDFFFINYTILFKWASGFTGSAKYIVYSFLFIRKKRKK